MVAGRPVLAVGAGVTEQLVRICGIGCTVHPDDANVLAEVLHQIATDYRGFREQYFRPDQQAIQRYERRELTRQLAMVFDELVGSCTLGQAKPNME